MIKINSIQQFKQKYLPKLYKKEQQVKTCPLCNKETIWIDNGFPKCSNPNCNNYTKLTYNNIPHNT